MISIKDKCQNDKTSVSNSFQTPYTSIPSITSSSWTYYPLQNSQGTTNNIATSSKYPIEYCTVHTEPSNQSIVYSDQHYQPVRTHSKYNYNTTNKLVMTHQHTLAYRDDDISDDAYTHHCNTPTTQTEYGNRTMNQIFVLTTSVPSMYPPTVQPSPTESAPPVRTTSPPKFHQHTH